MKLTLLLVLVFASVALLRAEEIVEDVEEQDEPSMNDLLDGSLDDEVLGNEEDPGHYRKHKRMMRRLGDKRVCGRVFIGCLRKTKARCSLVPVCKVHYFACRCIIRVARKCIGFLKWLKKVVRKHRKRHGKKHRHDEIEEDEDDEDAKRRRRRRLPGFVRKCKGGYRRCSKGKKFCGPCLKAFGGCLKKHIIKHFCNKHGHGQSKKRHDEDEDEETTMANAVENDDNDEIENEEDEADAHRRRRHRRRHRKLSAAQKRCAKSGYRCMLKARLNCRRQGRCVRRAMRCFRRVRRRRARKHRKQKHDE